MPSLDVQIVLIYILFRLYGNFAGIALFLITAHLTDGIAVMHQTIALVGMICFIISALYLYSFFSGQFNERLRSVFWFGPFGLVCGRLLSFALYIENDRNAAGSGKLPLLIVPYKLYRADLTLCFKRMP